MTESNRGSREEGEGRVTLGRVLAALRSAHGWTQADLAAASGVDKAQISRYERDVDRPSYRTQQALFEALHVSPGELHRLQATLDRIVTGQGHAEPVSTLSRAGLSLLADVMGFGESASSRASAGNEVRPDAEVDRLAREAGALAERLVRLHFARLGKD
jgi:transcriptional regulator with XRE-family HTH domain